MATVEQIELIKASARKSRAASAELRDDHPEMAAALIVLANAVDEVLKELDAWRGLVARSGEPIPDPVKMLRSLEAVDAGRTQPIEDVIRQLDPENELRNPGITR